MRNWLKTQIRRPWGIVVLRTLVAAYMWALYASCRKRFVIDPRTQALFDAKVPLLIGNWHGRLFLSAPFWRHKGHLPLSVISSPHADGLIVGGGAEVLGVTPLRGTRGGQGGAKALRAGLKALQAGQCLILNPDGPKGPRQVLGEGTAALAQLAGRPFVAMTSSAKRGMPNLKRWDRPLVPPFFSEVTFHVSAPLTFSRDQDREDVRQKIEALMNEQLWAADAAYGRDRIEADRAYV